MRYNHTQRNARGDLTIRTISLAIAAAQQQTRARRTIDDYLRATLPRLPAGERATWAPQLRAARDNLRAVSQDCGSLIRGARSCNGVTYHLGGVCPCPAALDQRRRAEGGERSPARPAAPRRRPVSEVN